MIGRPTSKREPSPGQIHKTLQNLYLRVPSHPAEEERSDKINYRDAQFLYTYPFSDLPCSVHNLFIVACSLSSHLFLFCSSIFFFTICPSLFFFAEPDVFLNFFKTVQKKVEVLSLFIFFSFSLSLSLFFFLPFSPPAFSSLSVVSRL